MKLNKNKKKIAIITGSAGFIGFHISKKLLDLGWRVVGIDCFSNYYDVSLKKARENILLEYASYIAIHEKIEKKNLLLRLFEKEKPNIVIHLAAQAGVRYSVTNPRSFLKSNIIGTFELLEAAKIHPPKHLLIASTSSIYGSSNNIPFKETQSTDYQLSFYAASKKSIENIAHSYSHNYNIPISIFRFFTVYGPWGRPDMALFKFTKSIIEKKSINIFNYGNMSRDFTYIDDLVESVVALIPKIPSLKNPSKLVSDSTSPSAPYRVLNIGNSKPEKLTDLIKLLEEELCLKANKKLLPIQVGELKDTWADSTLMTELTGFNPKVNLAEGICKFVSWYKKYYKIIEI